LTRLRGGSRFGEAKDTGVHAFLLMASTLDGRDESGRDS